MKRTNGGARLRRRSATYQVFHARDLSPKLYSAFLDYLEAEECWVGDQAAAGAAMLSPCLFPRLVRYAGGGKVAMTQDVRSLARWAFSNRRLDKRAWGDQRYSRAKEQVSQWLAWAALQRKARQAIHEEGKRRYNNQDIRTAALKERLRKAGVSSAGVALVRADWQADHRAHLACTVVARHFGEHPRAVKRGVEALARFRRLWRKADSARNIRVFVTAVSEAYAASGWRGRLCCASKPGSPPAAALVITLALNYLRGNARDVEEFLATSGALTPDSEPVAK